MTYVAIPIKNIKRIKNKDISTKVTRNNKYKTPITTNKTVYNFEVEDDHTYFVNDILVHNCQYCRAMNGTTVSEWAKFWFDIKGKEYMLDSPPLHWIFTKEGRKIITCRCQLAWTREAPELTDEVELKNPSTPDKKIIG